MLVALLMDSPCLHETKSLTDGDSLVVNAVLRPKYYKIRGLAGIFACARADSSSVKDFQFLRGENCSIFLSSSTGDGCLSLNF